MNLIELTPESVQCYGGMVEIIPKEDCFDTETVYSFMRRYNQIKAESRFERRNGLYLLFCVHEGTPIGICRCEKYPNYPGDGHIGYYIVPCMRRKGLSRLIVTEALSFSKANGFKQITAVISPQNKASVRCIESLGWKKTGKLYEWGHGLIGAEYIP